MRFECIQESVVTGWRDLVGTRWSDEALVQRLTGAWIPCLFTEERGLVATCVLRPHGTDIWILETLRALPGYGAPLMRALMRWIWDRVGPFILGFTWELTLAQLTVAWWRGWLGAAATVEYGWAFSVDGCHFCAQEWQPMTVPRFGLPTLVRGDGWSVVATDSGLGDGWGYVCRWSGAVDWAAVAECGGWKALWCRSKWAPAPKWHWTGEFVVVGLLNCWPEESVDWVTAEIALG